MSTQTADFPDFFRGTQQANTVSLNNELNVAKAAGTFRYGPFNVTEWEALNLFAVSSDRLDVQVQWLADAALTLPVGTNHYKAKSNQIAADVIPVMGPWFIMDVTFHVGAGNATASLILAARNGVRQWPAMIAVPFLLALPSAAIGAGATATLSPSYVTTGRGHLAIDTTATLWTATVTCTDEVGAAVAPVTKLQHGAVGDPCETDFILPSYPVQLAFTNNDAASRTWAAGLYVGRTA